MNTSTNQDVVKQAAKRMCEQLGLKGVKVKHSQMLEALAKGLGLDNWRKLKAVIDAPRTSKALQLDAKPATPEGEWQQWSVSALYLENSQQYGDSFAGRTALEAAVNAIMDRLTDFGLDIGILDVSNAQGKSFLNPSFVEEIKLWPNHRAFSMVRDAALVLRDAAKLQELDSLYASWLADVLQECADEGALDDLTDWDLLEKATGSAEEPFLSEGYEQTPSQALEALCDAVETAAGGVLRLEAENEDLALACYQVRATCTYFGSILNNSGFHDFALVDCPRVAG